ncbi:MAG TPA: PBP1A family penicillin-binding protein [Patescibacteria group bacterium]|nr:PBP1A family penicillin-binding protein [Patescibacteria group bacterium]
MWRERRRNLLGLQKSRNIAKLSKFGFLGIIVLFLGLFIILPLMAFSLPSPDKVVRREGFSTKILDRNGKPLYDIYEDERSTPIKIDEIPLYLKQATVAIEDKNFYSHQGFDLLGTLRGLSRLFTRGYAQGGSTLTQQLVKNVLLTSERSILRKLKEFILAVQIERKYSKDQILQMYFNEAPYGGNARGVETASEIYFGKSAKDLNLLESAIIAGFPQLPSRYSPYSSTPKAYIERTTNVLRRMREDGYITKDQEEASLAELPNVKFQAKGSSFKAPHFVQYVQKILEERYGEKIVEQGGLKVTTTLDLDLQEKAQAIVAEEIAKVESQKITNGGAVVVDSQTGEILAMVGSKKFDDPDYDGQVNVTVALRQPGSSFKPFTYVTAFKEGYTPSYMVMDVPTTFPGGEGQPDYNPVNYDGKYRGPIQLRFALGNSINIPAVKMIALVGIKDVLETSYDLGINSLPPTKETLARVGLSLTLGGGEVKLLEMTTSYSAFFNGGFRVDPISILKVEDSDGKVLEETKVKKGKQVLSTEQAFLISNILSDNGARSDVFGPNSLLNIPGRQVAVKTGTTNDKRDNWTIGGTPQRAVGVWVGNNDNSAMLNVASGVSGASPIWRKILIDSLTGLDPISFEAPGGIVTAEIDTFSGKLSHDGFSSRSEFFDKSNMPTEDDIHVKLKVCKGEEKLATPSDIVSGNFEEKEYYKIVEEDPTAGAGPNKWQEAILNWINSQSDSRYRPPTEYCGVNTPVFVKFDYPSDKDRINSNNFEIKVTPIAADAITRVELYIDNINVRNFEGQPYIYSATNVSNGVHTIKAVAKDSSGRQSEKIITIGINTDWNSSSTPTP